MILKARFQQFHLGTYFTDRALRSEYVVTKYQHDKVKKEYLNMNTGQ